ncbi:reverse transcriptase domain-containing protein [Marinobacter salarius]
MGQTALHRIAGPSQLKKSWNKINARARGPKRRVAGVDEKTVDDFSRDVDAYIREIRRDLLSRQYVFSDLLAFSLPKSGGGHRIINIPTVDDRVVQSALLEFLSDKSSFKSRSNYGFLRKKTVSMAVSKFVRSRHDSPYVVKVDLQAFFDTIPRADLREKVEKKVRYVSVRSLIFGIINCESRFRSPTDLRNAKRQGLKPGVGVRQGMPLSPFLANLYLDQFDVFIEKQGYKLIRYADDFVILCGTKAEADAAKADAVFLLTKIGLSVNDKKTSISGPEQTVEFLGIDCVQTQNEHYALEVSRDKIRRLVSNIAAFQDVKYCLNNGVRLVGLERRIDLMISGYLQAYQACANIRKIQHKLYAAKNKAIGQLFTQIFGIKIDSLTEEQQIFLGLDSSYSKLER